MDHTALMLEFLLLFVILPLAYRFAPIPIPALPALWLVTAYACTQLWLDPRFDRGRLWGLRAIAPELPSILLIFAASATVIWFGTHHFARHLEWNFMRQHPGLWAIVMLAYPVLSVYPQGLIYRAFFFERYSTIFPGQGSMILASAAAFAFMHIIFRNRLAVGLTFAGGLLFAWRYTKTGSLATSSFEHALYGCWLFTVGLGQYFYYGTMKTMESLVRR